MALNSTGLADQALEILIGKRAGLEGSGYGSDDQ